MPLIPQVTVRYIKYLFGYRCKLAEFTKKSKVFKKIVHRMLFYEDDMIVVPKDHTVTRRVDINVEIEGAADRTIVPSDVVKGIIDNAKDIFIMNFCLCRKSNGCKDYPVEQGCIFMGEGIHKIPKEFGRIVSAAEAKLHIDRCGELGLVHIIGRNKIDSMWLNTGDKTNLMTLCNCCPCCCLWNIARNVHDDIGKTFRRMEGVEVSIDTHSCDGCGQCADICFTRAVKVVDGKACIDQDMCRGCGRCKEMCIKDAITITFEPSMIKKEIERISALVNLGRDPQWTPRQISE